MNTSRSLWLNLLILGLAAASLVAIVVTNRSPTTKDRQGREQNLLPVFQSEAVLSLELAANGQQIALSRGAAPDGGSATFELTAPVKELADAATVDKFLAGLGSAKALRPVTGSLPRATLGLEPPSSRIVIRTAKLSYELSVGGQAPAPEGARYVEVKRDDAAPAILLVAKSVAEDLAFDLDAFRLRSVISVREADVTKLSIKSKTLDLSLTRGPGNAFFLDSEPKFRADRDLVRSLFFQLGRLSASRFLSASQAEAALGPEHAHFELETRASKGVLAFDLGGNCPGDDSLQVIVRRAPSTQGACVSRELEATLSAKRDAFFDEHPFSLHVDEVEELGIVNGTKKLRLVRKGTSFVLHAKTDSDVELESGNQRITDLLEPRGARVVGAKLSELGLDPEQGKVTLRSSGGGESDVISETVRVGKRDAAGDLDVYREADGITLKIPRDQARAFGLDSTLLYSKKLSEFGPSSFVSAEIERGAQREVLRRGPNDALQLDSPPGFGPDGGLSADVIQALGALSAERFVADADDGSFGLSHARLIVHFTYKGEANATLSHSLRFGDETALGVFATLDQGGPVFVLPRMVRDTLDTLLVNRSVYSTEPASLESFTLEHNQRMLAFERRGDHFAVSKGAFPADRLEELLEALGNLRPEAALHTGPAEPAEGFAKPSLKLTVSPKKEPPQSLTFGAGDSWRTTSIFYLRVSGVNATFVIAQSKVRALSAAF